MGWSWTGSVLVAGLLMLAGCSGLLPAEDTPAKTVTPAPIPSPSSSPRTTAEPSFPPGIVTGEVVDPIALERAHARALRDASYTVRVNETARYANGSLRSQMISTARVGPNGTQKLRTIRVVGPEERPPVFPNASEVIIYAEELDAFIRGGAGRNTQSPDNETAVQYASRQVPAGVLPPFWPGLKIGILGQLMELRVTRIQQGTETRYLVSSIQPVESSLLAQPLNAGKQAQVENPTLQALIDPRGLIHRYRLTYTLRRDGTEIYVNRSIRYQNIGTTVVERPTWYQEAVNATTTVSRKVGP